MTDTQILNTDYEALYSRTRERLRQYVIQAGQAEGDSRADINACLRTEGLEPMLESVVVDVVIHAEVRVLLDGADLGDLEDVAHSIRSNIETGEELVVLHWSSSLSVDEVMASDIVVKEVREDV